MLGSAAQGEFETFLGPYSKCAEPAAARLAKAVEFCGALSCYVKAQSHELSTQIAWTALHKVAARALDFDLRMCPPEALSEITAVHKAALQNVVRDILAIVDLDDLAWRQLALPTRLGGGGVRECSPAFAQASS